MRRGVIALAMLLGSTAASAAPKVLVLTEDQEDPVARRLEAELSTLGLETILARPGAEEGPVHERLDRATRRHGAIAALRLIPRRGGVIEVWLTDRVTGKTSLRELRPSAGEATEITATRALELLRASLLELQQEAPRRGDVEAPREVLALVPQAAQPPREEPAPMNNALLLGPGLGWSAGGATPFAQGAILFRRLGTAGVGPEIQASLPLLAARVEGSEGSASLRLWTAAAGFRIARPLGPLEATAGGGVGYAQLSMEGAPRGPYEASSDTTRSLLFYAAAGALLRLSPRLAVGADAQIAITAPAHQILFAGRTAASWGLPVLSIAALTELRF